MGDAFSDHFISLEIMRTNEIKEKLSEIKDNNVIEKVVDAKIAVISFNHHVL